MNYEQITDILFTVFEGGYADYGRREDGTGWFVVDTIGDLTAEEIDWLIAEWERRHPDNAFPAK